jgi:preprotein translocase subunit SecF
MNITKYEKYLFIVPAVFSLLAIIAIAMWGLKPGIDLAGGSLLEVKYPAGRPAVEMVHQKVDGLGLGEIRIQPTGDTGYILRQKDLTDTERQTLLQPLRNLGEMEEVQFNSVGPILGAELVSKAWIAIVLVVASIIAFIAFAFRGVSKPVASWKYGVVAIVTLLHDILLPVGLFAALGHFIGAEVDALFIVALLTILGISINDTIVVFDRIRENLKINHDRNKRENFDEVVGRSITQTLARSINTSLTVIIVLVALYILGPIATKTFALTLIVGMVAGTYSSIFLASPLLVVWERLQKKS